RRVVLDLRRVDDDHVVVAAISGRRRGSSRDGSATLRNVTACGGVIRGSIAARSDHPRALPEGSASTSSTLLPARENTCASQTAEVVLPVPGLRLARARLRPVIQAVYASTLGTKAPQRRHTGGRHAHRDRTSAHIEHPALRT